MTSRLITLVVLICAGALPSLAGQESHENPEVRKAIEAMNARYISAFKNADAAGVAGVYDENGSRLYPKGVVIRGRKAIRADLEKFIKDVGPVTVALDTLGVWLVDDTAYETGKWSYTFTPPGRQQRTMGGRYVTTWRKQKDGGWKIVADLGID
jgi:uncharacterized protein (TIGR02246 family)